MASWKKVLRLILITLSSSLAIFLEYLSNDKRDESILYVGFIRRSFIPFPDQLGPNPPCPLSSLTGSVTWALREVFCGWSRLANLPSPSGRDFCARF